MDWVPPLPSSPPPPPNHMPLFRLEFGWINDSPPPPGFLGIMPLLMSTVTRDPTDSGLSERLGIEAQVTASTVFWTGDLFLEIQMSYTLSPGWSAIAPLWVTSLSFIFISDNFIIMNIDEYVYIYSRYIKVELSEETLFDGQLMISKHSTHWHFVRTMLHNWPSKPAIMLQYIRYLGLLFVSVLDNNGIWDMKGRSGKVPLRIQIS